MTDVWRKVGSGLGRRWVVVAAVTLLVTAALGVGFTRVDFATGQDSYLNSDSQIALDNVEYQEAFGGETVILLFEVEDGSDITQLFTPGNQAELQRLEEELRAIPEHYAVITPLTSLTWSDNIATSGAGTNALISAAQRAEDPESKARRDADIQMSLKRLGAAGDQSFDNPQWIEFLLFGNDDFTVDAGDELVAPPVPTIRLSLAPTFPGLDVAVGGVVLKGNATLDELSAGTAAIVDVMSTADLDGITVTVTGAPLFLKDINDYLQGGMIVLGVTAIAVMAVILLLLFPVRLRLLPLVSVVFGVLWSFSILGWLGIDLSLVTIAGLPILIGVGIDFAIQVHSRFEEEVSLDRDPAPMAETISNLGPPLVVATIAGIGAFIALQVSLVPMIRDFGVLLSVGIAVLLVLGILLPGAVLGARSWKKRGARTGEWVERLVIRLGSMRPSLVVPVAAIAVALFVGGLLTEGNTRIESDPLRWVDQSSQSVTDIELLEERTGFASTLGVLIESGNVFDPAVIDVVHDFVIDAEARDAVVSTSSIEGTMAKVIQVPGAEVLRPRPVDLEAAAAVMPPDIERALLANDRTATQVNLRLAQASLDERAVLVADLERDLQQRIDSLEPPAESVLPSAVDEGQPLLRAVPSGLAVVGVGLLENLSSNRALLTYLALAIVAFWLVVRHRSLTRGLLVMVPVLLAIGVSSLVVGGLGLTLSPLTTVSGPLVVATCTEFSVLILARYLEERQRGLSSHEASVTASGRTGRAFFTSAATTIGGFATLVVSPLPLLRDFGLIVTLNVGVALLAALVVMPPLVLWADTRGLLAVERRPRGLLLAAPARGASFAVALAAAGALALTAALLFGAADRGDGVASAVTYEPVALPTTTTPPPDEEQAGIDPESYGTDRPSGVVAGILFDLLTEQGVPANKAVCTGEVLLSRVSEADLLASGLATFSDEAVEPVVVAARDCGVAEEQIQATLTAARAG